MILLHDHDSGREMAFPVDQIVYASNHGGGRVWVQLRNEAHGFYVREAPSEIVSLFGSGGKYV